MTDQNVKVASTLEKKAQNGESSQNSTRKLRVGFIGCGRILSLNILGYINHPDVEIYAMCDKKRKKARQAAAEWGAKVIYKDYNDLIKDEKVDIVEVLTPHKMHLPITLAACEAGKHVSLQKPPALRLSDLDAMIRAARKAGVKFKVFENFRFHPPYMRAMELIKQGIIGDVYVVNYRMWSSIHPLSSWKVPLGTWKWRIEEENNYKMPNMFDDGYHKHSVIRMFLNRSIRSVQAWAGGYRIYKVIKVVDMPAVVIYKTKSSAKYGVWNLSVGPRLPIKSEYYGCDEAVEIQGSKGILFINGCTGNMFAGCECGGPGAPGLYWIDERGEWHGECDMKTNWKWSFINSTRHFIEAIKNNTEPILSGKDAREILQITLGIVKSLRSGFQDIKLNTIVDGIEGEETVMEEEGIEIESYEGAFGVEN
ncbi:MAG: Gfo/Idh/MocA family protein [Candidatus Helarchaeota archaeon]